MRTSIIKNCKLKYLLAERNMTQSHLAYVTKIDKCQISKYVTNSKEMSIGTGYVISRALGCHIEDLYEWND